MDFQHTDYPIEHEYPKLVRDNIPSIIKERSGIDADIKQIEDDDEFLNFLFKKIVEEASELGRSTSRENGQEEIADMYEIVDAILGLWDKTEQDIRKIQSEKRKKNGGFKERIVLLSKVSNKKAETIATYNRSAARLAEKFDNLGVRVSDIEETFALIKKQNPKVVEIGCGNGRDAVEILKRTSDYLGVDVSEELIKLARQKAPQGKFEVADIATFSFPENLDIVFAFASLIHLNREDFAMVLDKIFSMLNPGGAVRISLKYSEAYKEVTKEDEFGKRTYYHYSQEDLRELAKNFKFIKNELNDLRGQKWLEILLQK